MARIGDGVAGIALSLAVACAGLMGNGCSSDDNSSGSSASSGGSGGSSTSSGSGGSSTSSGSGGSSSGSGGSSTSSSGSSTSSSGSGGNGGSGVAAANCDALAKPVGNVINVTVAQAGQLQGIVSGAQSGDTISLADGTYTLNGAFLYFKTPNVTLRSTSGNRKAVILDGNYQGTEIVTVAASNVTIADLTIQKAYTHPIHVTTSGNSDTLNTLIYNVHIIDPREQAIKINPDYGNAFVDYGEIACSHLELTDQGRPLVQPVPDGCYTGGVDAHQARGWVIRDNRIEGFWCNTGISEHAVHCWYGCRDTVVERNVLVNNARGVGFGLLNSGTARTYADNPCPAAGNGYVGHYDGIVRNNFIFANDQGLLQSPNGFDCGICFWSACGAKAVHNTVVSTGPNFSSIEWRFSTSTGVEITNNIATHPLLERNSASATQAGNLENAQLSLFLDGGAGKLHLAAGASAAIDQGVSVPAGVCDDDIDNEARSGPRDIGADEIP